MKKYIQLALKGMAMGAADVVPGVSGGTIAFISGIYEELINSLKSINLDSIKLLLKGDFKAFWNAINGNFLITLLTGILISIFSLAKLIHYLLDTQPILVWSFFFGLILASIVFVGQKIKSYNLTTILFFLIGGAIAFYVTIAAPTTTPDGLIFVFISGVIAICAMVLPGISGSFILLLMGKYHYILGSVKSLNLPVLIVFALGCGIGIISFARVVSFLFNKYHDATVALLTGFMLGSMNKVWPWKEVLQFTTDSDGKQSPLFEKSILPTTYEQIYNTNPMIIQAIIAAVVGFVLIFALEKLSEKKSV